MPLKRPLSLGQSTILFFPNQLEKATITAGFSQLAQRHRQSRTTRTAPNKSGLVHHYSVIVAHFQHPLRFVTIEPQ